MRSSFIYWYQLYDASTSLPYMETTATSVSLPPGSLVVDFRKAVKVKGADLLSSFDADELIVYKNKLSFDKRNVISAAAVVVEEGMEEPLEEDSLVDGLGTSMKKALVVVVPMLIQRFQPKSTAFPPCQKPFFNSICDATERDGWLSFGHEIPGTSFSKLYIRDCHRTMAASINHRITTNKASITGTPGIGKSFFLFYLLWTLVKEGGGKRVLFIHHSFHIYYDGKGGVFQFASGDLPNFMGTHSFWDHSLWCLLNANGKNDDALNEFPCDYCRFILSTSPRRKLINDFKKGPELEEFYMPTWTEAELEAIAPLFPHSTEWRNRFEILGGIPHYVLKDTTQTPTEILQAACDACSLDDDVIKPIGIYSEITETSKSIHLVHMTSFPPFTDRSVSCFASSTALDIILQRKAEEVRLGMVTIMDDCRWSPLAATMRGYFIEPFVLQLLENGGTFKCRPLVRGAKNAKLGETFVEILPSTKKVVKRVEANQTRNILHVPETRNGAAFDAWIPGIGAFQMTVGRNHGINCFTKDDLTKLGGPNILYWCLPRDSYDSFTKKNPQDINQYAILLPFPEDYYRRSA